MDISISGSLEGDLGIDKMINNLKEIDGKAVEAGRKTARCVAV